MKVNVYKESGESTETVELNSRIFALPKVKPAVVHAVATAILSSLRSPIAATKTRAEVRGGGKKPWQQKGTGRARAGSIRSPLWRGGGITFGPQSTRNFAKKINRKTKRVGLFSIFTDKFQSSQIFILDDLDLPEAKTKILAQRLETLRKRFPTLGRKVMLIVTGKEKKLARAARNLPNVIVNRASHLNILDLLSVGSVIILKPALPIIEETYLK